MQLKFVGYRVENSSFTANEIPKGTTNMTLNPNIQMDIKKDPKNLFLTITVSVMGSEDKPTPFDLSVRIKGSFAIVEDSLDINRMRIDSSRVLFPYVRAYIATYTALNGMPPYTLPLIDFEGTPVNKGVAPTPTTPQGGKKSGIGEVKIIPPDSI